MPSFKHLVKFLFNEFELHSYSHDRKLIEKCNQFENGLQLKTLVAFENLCLFFFSSFWKVNVFILVLMMLVESSLLGECV